MKKLLFTTLVAAGMAFGFANAGFAHEIMNEYKGCNKARVCLEKTTCGKLDGRVVCYPTTCGPANCDPHMHLVPHNQIMKNGKK